MKHLHITLTLFFMIGWGVQTKAAELSEDSTVYWNPKKGRFHHPDCPRYGRAKKADPDAFRTMTQKEGLDKKLAYCSKCPVDKAYKADGFKTKMEGRRETPLKAVTVHRDLEPRMPVTIGADGKLVYHPYTDKGDVIMDYSHSGYKASEVPIPDVPVVLTVEPLPDSPPALRRPKPQPKGVADGNQGPMVWFNNKKRFHDERCRRAGDSIKNSPEEWTQISYRKGILSGLDYCSRCPEDAPRIEVEAPDPEEHTPFMAYPDGQDSQPRIQAAIDKVGAMAPNADGFRGAVLLRKGSYYLKSQLTVTAGVVLRGEGDGEDGTVLVFHNPKGKGIVLGNKETEGGSAPEVKTFRTDIADTYVPVGSTSVHVVDASGFKVGDPVKVIKTTNENWLVTIGMHSSQVKMRRPWTPKAYQLATPRRITATEGNRITFDVPLPQGYVAEHGGGAVETDPKADLKPSMIGVEHLRVISNYDRKPTSVMRAREGAYEADEEENMYSGIYVDGATHSWVRNCTVMHPSRNSFATKNSQFVTIRDCTSLDPISIVRGGRRYCFSNSDSSMVLFYRCSAEKGRHPYVTGSRDPGPIAFVRSTTVGGASEAHSRWASGILWDNITVTGRGSIFSGNRGRGGSGHGWSGVNGVLWNCTGSGLKVQNPPTPEQNFAIGGVITDGGEVSGDGFIYSRGEHVQPESLFEAQLIDRIGKEQAMKVLR